MKMNDKKRVIEELVKIMNKQFEENQLKPDQYVVGYYRIDNNELIGYHQSTACQLTEDVLEGKRYNGDNPYEQLAIIAKNLKYILNSSDEDPGFLGFANITRKDFFEGYKDGDIYLKEVYLSDGTPPQQLIYTSE